MPTSLVPFQGNDTVPIIQNHYKGFTCSTNGSNLNTVTPLQLGSEAKVASSNS